MLAERPGPVKKKGASEKRQFVKEAYIAAINWGLTPAEFWRMHPTELWWWFEAKLGVKKIGSMTQDDADELIEFMESRGIE